VLGILAFCIPYISHISRPIYGDPLANIGDGIGIFFIYLSLLIYLILTVVSSAMGWSASEQVANKIAFKWVFRVSSFLLVIYLIFIVASLFYR